MTTHLRGLLVALAYPIGLSTFDGIFSFLLLYDDTVSAFGYGASAVIDELAIELLTDEEVEDDLDGEYGETFDVVAALEGDEFDNDERLMHLLQKLLLRL